MPVRQVNYRRLKKYSIGDLRERITLHTRVITAPGYSGIAASEAYDAGTALWASCETLDKKRKMFNGVNIPEGATHSFIIRFDSSVTAENVIAYEGEYYDILKTSDPDKRKQYLELFSRVKGDSSLAANQ